MGVVISFFLSSIFHTSPLIVSPLRIMYLEAFSSFRGSLAGGEELVHSNVLLFSMF